MTLTHLMTSAHTLQTSGTAGNVRRRPDVVGEDELTSIRLRNVLAREDALLRARDEMIHKLLACRQSAAKRVARLTPREREVLQMVLAGHPSKNIAADLDISQRTVESHRAAIMKKTGSKCLPALARLALAAGWSDMQVPWAPADACNMDHPDPVSAGPPQASGCHGSTTRLDALGTNPTIDLLLMYGGVVAGFISPHDMPGPRSGPTRHLAKHGGDAWVPSSSSSC